MSFVSAIDIRHLKRTVNLAYPVILGQLGQILISVTDNVMIGNLENQGSDSLAAISLANSIFFLIMMMGIGISVAILPLIAQEEGRSLSDSGIIIRQGVLVSIFSGLIMTSLVFISSYYLGYLGQPQPVVDLAGEYLRITSFSIIPMMVFLAYKHFLEALNYPLAGMLVTFVMVGLNIAGNFLLIYGVGGWIEPMYLNGAGYATLGARALGMAGMFGIGLIIKRVRVLGPVPRLNEWKPAIIRRLLKLGIPTGLQYLFEFSAFSFTAIMMGWIGKHSLAAHQIAINLASITYLVTSGLGSAASIRTGNFAGGGAYKSASRAGFIAIGLGAVFMLFCAAIFIAGKSLLPSLYVKDGEVISIASSLIVMAAFFQVSDGIQVVAAGALRGISDVNIPTGISLFSYWVLGVPIGYLLGFHTGMGPSGIWAGLLAGLTFAAILLTIRFKTLSDKLGKKRQRYSSE